MLEEDNCALCEDQQFDIKGMDSYLDNLEAAATQEKEMIEKLVNDNKNLITQLEAFTKSPRNFQVNTIVPALVVLLHLMERR